MPSDFPYLYNAQTNDKLKNTNKMHKEASADILGEQIKVKYFWPTKWCNAHFIFDGQSISASDNSNYLYLNPPLDARLLITSHSVVLYTAKGDYWTLISEGNGAKYTENQ